MYPSNADLMKFTIVYKKVNFVPVVLRMKFVDVLSVVGKFLSETDISVAMGATYVKVWQI